MSLGARSAKPVGVVLAGGRSSRMGCEKSLLDLAGKPLLRHAIERLEGGVSALVLSANGDPSRFATYDLPVVPDQIEGFKGPLAGVHAGMLWTAAHFPDVLHIVTIASDTPFFPRDLIKALGNALDGEAGMTAIASSNGRLHPAFGLWPVRHAKALEVFLRAGNHRMHDWIEQHDYKAVSFPNEFRAGFSLDPFFNINQEEDLKKAQKWGETENN